MHLIIKSAGLMRSSLSLSLSRAHCGNNECNLPHRLLFIRVLRLPVDLATGREESERKTKAGGVSYARTNRSFLSFHHFADIARMRFAGATGEFSATPRRAVPRR